MEVSNQIQAPAAVPPRKELPDKGHPGTGHEDPEGE